MKAIIFGASSRSSLGYSIGEYLKQNNKYEVIYASRSGKLGVKCDINSPQQVYSIFSKEKPDLVINAAGIFHKPQILGSYKEIDQIRDHVLAKSFGAFMIADASARTPSVKNIIMLGGRAVSSNPGFAAYSIGNGALSALVSFFAKHSHPSNIYYIDLPSVKDTTMQKLLEISSGKSALQTDIQSVINIVEKILKNKYKNGSRIIINKKSKL